MKWMAIESNVLKPKIEENLINNTWKSSKELSLSKYVSCRELYKLKKNKVYLKMKVCLIHPNIYGKNFR